MTLLIRNRFGFLLGILCLLNSCADEKQTSPDQVELSSDPRDTLSHGVRLELKGEKIDSINVQVEEVVFEERLFTDAAYALAESPDTVRNFDSKSYFVGKDSIKDAEEFVLETWTEQMIYPGAIEIGAPYGRDNSQYDIHYLSKKSGLPSSAISSISLDRSGNLWIGTYGKGFIRYDGSKVLHFTKEQGLVDNGVSSIFQDSRGQHWILTNRGYSRFDGKYFYNYLIPDSLNARATVCLEDEGGNIWMGTWGAGLLQIQPDGKILRYAKEQGFSDNAIYDLGLDNEGVLWLGVRNQGLVSYANGEFKHFIGQPFRQSVRALDFDNRGGVWLGTEHGLLHFNGEYFLDYQETKILGDNLVWAVKVDSKDRLWTATYRNGVSCLDGQFIRMFNSETGMNSNTARSICEDAHGSIWFGTDEGGVNILDPNGFEYTRTLAGESLIDVREINSQDGVVWICPYGKGVFKIEDQKVEELTAGWDRLVEQIYFDEPGDMWMAGYYRLFKKVGDTALFYDFYIDGNFPSIKSIAEDDNGNMWFGRKNGMLRFDGTDFYRYDRTTGFTNSSVQSIVCDGEELWVGTQTEGLYHINEEGFIRYSEEEGLGSENIRCMYKNEDGLWIGTNGEGLYLYANGEFVNYTVNDGLSDEYVRAITEDDYGRLWITTQDGITVRQNDQLIPFSIETGMSMGSFKRNATTIDDLGRIWVGSGTGYASFQTRNFVLDTISPIVKINDVLLKHRTVNYRELESAQLNSEDYFIEETETNLNEVRFDSVIQFTNCPQGLVLPHHINELTVEFSVLDINKTQQYEYSYLLDGAESDWSPYSLENKAKFTNLSSGDYTLRVVARNQFGVVSEESKYSFTILTPWWETIYAYIAYVLIVLLGFYSFVRIRTNRLRARQKQLEGLVNDRTAELKLQKEEVERKNHEISDSINYAKRIQEAILPSDQLFIDNLSKGFTLYLPKDIVAGDFYWLDVVEQGSESIVLFAVGDCTGHGVPGAMVSVVCNEAMNRSVKEFHLSEPAEILDKTRSLVLNSFAKSDHDVKDGMDVALCALQGNKLLYAGANNPLWILRNGEIIEIKGDKQPVGAFERSKPFSQHETLLEKGDKIYIFTDGLPDQFGGPKGKKYKYKQFKELIISTSDHDMDTQGEMIKEAFEKWKGSIEQVDDVCVLGIEFVGD